MKVFPNEQPIMTSTQKNMLRRGARPRKLTGRGGQKNRLFELAG